jgi:hypothetical protein
MRLHADLCRILSALWHTTPQYLQLQPEQALHAYANAASLTHAKF